MVAGGGRRPSTSIVFNFGLKVFITYYKMGSSGPNSYRDELQTQLGRGGLTTITRKNAYEVP
jgi:hypothetical protein